MLFQLASEHINQYSLPPRAPEIHSIGGGDDFCWIASDYLHTRQQKELKNKNI
jgi:hypothetical protein